MKRAALNAAFCLGLGAVLGCAQAVDPPPAQTDTRAGDEETGVTTWVEQDPPSDAEIDYENAQPIPMPSVPDPPDGTPELPTEDPTHIPPGESYPGETGDGQENPEVLIPPAS